MLYIAAHHVLQHGDLSERRLIWFYDLHLLLARCGERIDWEAVFYQARRFAWSSALVEALLQTRWLLGTPLPPDVLSHLHQVRRGQQQQKTTYPAELSRHRVALVWHELADLNWSGRLALVQAHLIPSPNYIRWRYAPRPEWLWPLCYLYRWFTMLNDSLRLIQQMARRWWQRNA
jgi:hypothetical protein